MAAIDEPLWLLERWWPSKGHWVVSEIQTMEIVDENFVHVRSKKQAATYARLIVLLAKAVERWPDTLSKADFRLRNIRTKDIVLGVLL
jgi:hypothetical protein